MSHHPTPPPVRHAPIRRAVLANGLRVLAAPEPGSGVAAVAVHYAVGFRSEPPGRAGFAHLLEHLVFQGGEHLDRMDHFRHVQAAGGSGNAVTSRDHTCYHQYAPSAVLERVLFLEADRMRAPHFTAARLATQLAVIREEVGANVKGRPYGGLPWLLLPPVLFESFANSHDGYGAVAQLAAATVAEAELFFERHYAPANAVLTVVSDVDPGRVLELADRHFGSIAARPVPTRTELDEPTRTADRAAVHDDLLAPLPATVVGWRLPGPADTGRLSYAVLAAVLADGELARLRGRLVRDGGANRVGATPYLSGGLLESRDPDAFVVTAMYQSGPGSAGGAGSAGSAGGPGSGSVAAHEAVLEAVSAELELLAANGPDRDELVSAAGRTATGRKHLLRDLRKRAQLLGGYEIMHGRAELAWELADQARSVSAREVALAAAELARAPRAILHVRTEAERAAAGGAGAAGSSGSSGAAGSSEAAGADSGSGGASAQFGASRRLMPFGRSASVLDGITR